MPNVLKYLDVNQSQVTTNVSAGRSHCISVLVCPKMKWNTTTLISYLRMDMLYKDEVILHSDKSKLRNTIFGVLTVIDESF